MRNKFNTPVIIKFPFWEYTKKHMDKHDLINQLQLDTMAEHFEKAISQAADALQEKGYKNAGTIRDKILETSGYRYL